MTEKHQRVTKAVEAAGGPGQAVEEHYQQQLADLQWQLREKDERLRQQHVQLMAVSTHVKQQKRGGQRDRSIPPLLCVDYDEDQPVMGGHSRSKSAPSAWGMLFCEASKEVGSEEEDDDEGGAW
mmetsp:Transcript_16843/g.39325  ORF Transcript_16843/g.39325 Transcript_16843/m.39325 type:complete len:124 (-) Transcript_16843:263-634(-)